MQRRRRHPRQVSDFFSLGNSDPACLGLQTSIGHTRMQSMFRGLTCPMTGSVGCLHRERMEDVSSAIERCGTSSKPELSHHVPANSKPAFVRADVITGSHCFARRWRAACALHDPGAGGAARNRSHVPRAIRRAARPLHGGVMLRHPLALRMRPAFRFPFR